MIVFNRFDFVKYYQKSIVSQTVTPSLGLHFFIRLIESDVSILLESNLLVMISLHHFGFLQCLFLLLILDNFFFFLLDLVHNEYSSMHFRTVMNRLSCTNSFTVIQVMKLVSRDNDKDGEKDSLIR